MGKSESTAERISKSYQRVQTSGDGAGKMRLGDSRPDSCVRVYAEADASQTTYGVRRRKEEGRQPVVLAWYGSVIDHDAKYSL